MDIGLNNLNPKLKIIGAMVLAFTFSFIKSIELLPVIFFISLVIYYLSKLPLSLLLKRWIIPAPFVILMGLFMMFFSEGQTVLTIGYLSIKKEGIYWALTIITKFLSILTIMVTLFQTTHFIDIVRALNSLGVPAILTDIIIFTYRYIFEIGKQLNKMQISMRLRGFRNRGLKNIISLVSLVGTILVRSYEQSEKVYNAMILRGYGHKESVKQDLKLCKSDILGVFIVVAISIGLITVQIGLSWGGF
ncbi:cobalt ECF transporter T component CbiQ [Thermohalobacter berrensis]|uniref:Cobalt ECF transporter T component CbiQ n=1 Tax=Thermohalobacter berrensis TaxID=99594 RepID=A0A419SU77_9FIRM|nr:cobalt ECF transporter T component CbiQ [Thermohalobacter berrensis]RKD28789.1 cobalt ECF transporter T component CbiQ [Thermohalobacter berrensis]